jgi:D-glycero-alpha-D-manno-heptose-7-phosphate kinase
MYTFRGVQVTHDQLAEEACMIEIEILKKPIGKQDQYIAAHGGLSAITFHGSERVTTDSIELTQRERHELGGRFMLFFTNVTRQASSILTEQREKTGENRSQLRAIYELGRKVEDAVRNRRFDEIGEILDENWTLKKRLASGITSPQIDGMYTRARAAGAIGGKVAGAGGGGFLLLYVKPEHQAKVRAALSDYRQMPVMLDDFGATIIFNQRRYTW